MGEYREKGERIQEAIEHFGITEEELEGGIWVVDNTVRARKNWGIEGDLQVAGAEVRKARIIIDYEAGYPLIVKRVIAG